MKYSIRVNLRQSHPFDLALEKTKITARPGSPAVIIRHSYAAFFNDSEYVLFDKVIVHERKYRSDIGFCRYIADAVLVRS